MSKQGPQSPVKLNWAGRQVFRPAHQAYAPEEVGRPKYSYVPPQSGQADGAWRSAGHFLDFVVPRTVGALKSLMLRFSIANSGSEFSGAPNTCFWVQTIEETVGTTTIETLYPNDIYNETVGFLSTDELVTEGGLIGVPTPYPPQNSLFSINMYSSHSPIKEGRSTWYLPLRCALVSARFFVRGVLDDVKIRVYFPPTLFPSHISLQDCTLIVEETVLSLGEYQQQVEAHRTGMIYQTVVRQRQNQTVSRTEGAPNEINLTGIIGNSAGLIIYSGPPVQPGYTEHYTNTSNTDPVTSTITVTHTLDTPSGNSQLTTRYEIPTLTLTDSQGNKRTEELRGQWLKTFTWANQVGTSFANADKGSTYLIPFCANFKHTVCSGNPSGELYTDGTDRLVLGNANSSQTWSATVTNYAYQALVVADNKFQTVLKKFDSPYQIA